MPHNPQNPSPRVAVKTSRKNLDYSGMNPDLDQRSASRSNKRRPIQGVDFTLGYKTTKIRCIVSEICSQTKIKTDETDISAGLEYS